MCLFVRQKERTEKIKESHGIFVDFPTNSDWERVPLLFGEKIVIILLKNMQHRKNNYYYTHNFGDIEQIFLRM